MTKKQVWKKVGTIDIKYDTLTLDAFLEQIKTFVPEGTKNEDIQVSFEVDYETSYYDEIIIDAVMEISVKEQ
jgi:hypothetical protein